MTLLAKLRRDLRSRVREARIAMTTVPRPKPKPKPKHRRYRCGECNRLGHNARTCPRRRS